MTTNTITTLFTNKIFLSFIIGIIISNSLKFIFELIINKTVDYKKIFKNGGMPSGHTTSICAAASTIFFIEGVTNLFVLSLIVATFIIYDARGIRNESSKHAKLLNFISKKSNLKEDLGHTTTEIIVGIILGIIIGYATFLL